MLGAPYRNAQNTYNQAKLTLDSLLLNAAVRSSAEHVVVPIRSGGVFCEESGIMTVPIESDTIDIHGQDGTPDTDYVESVVIMWDNSIIMSGSTNGSFGSLNDGLFDFVAWKLSSSGTVVWRWQVSERRIHHQDLVLPLSNDPRDPYFQGWCTELVE